MAKRNGKPTGDEMAPPPDRRARIRDTARRLFLEQGYDRVSTDAIIAAAGIKSKETLYRHFKSKDDLLLDVIRSMTVEGAQLGPIMAQSLEPATPEALRRTLTAVAEAIFRTMMQPDYISLMRIVVSAPAGLSHIAELYRTAVPMRAMSFLTTLIRTAQNAGLVDRERTAEGVARLILGVPLTYAVFDGLLRSENGIDPRRPARMRAVIEDTLHVVMNGVAPVRDNTEEVQDE